MTGWRAYYTEGRVFTSKDTEWTALPEEGVLVVVAEFDTGRTIHTSGDWYYMEQGQVKRVPSGDEWGVWQPRPEVACASCVKKAGVVGDEEFKDLYEKVWHGDV